MAQQDIKISQEKYTELLKEICGLYKDWDKLFKENIELKEKLRELEDKNTRKGKELVRMDFSLN
jgi:heme oxygenase